MSSPGLRSIVTVPFTHGAAFYPEKVVVPQVTSLGAKNMAESEEELDVLVQRVVKDITNAFKRNPNM